MSKSKITKIKWPKNLGLEEWLQLRKEVEGIGKDFVRIGASDVVVAVAPTKWKCPARLYSHLIGEYSNASISEETAAGHALEPIVADRFMGYIPDDPIQSLYNWQYKTKVRKIKKAEFFILNADYPWLSASLDYVPVGKVYSPFTGELYNPLTPIEIKTTKKGYFIMWGGDMPFAYKLQINTQMLLTDTKVAVFNVFVDGSNYHVFEVERDDLL